MAAELNTSESNGILPPQHNNNTKMISGIVVCSAAVVGSYIVYYYYQYDEYPSPCNICYNVCCLRGVTTEHSDDYIASGADLA